MEGSRDEALDESRVAYDGELFDVTSSVGACTTARLSKSIRKLSQSSPWMPRTTYRASAPAARAGNGRSCSSFPHGTLDEGEEPLASARRELRRRRASAAATGGTHVSFWTTPGFSRELMHVFFAERVEEGEQRLEDDKFKKKSVRSWSAAQARGMPVNAGLCDDA